MIERTSQQQLSLLFPNSNKAISKILESASPEQLETLAKAKDLKAVLSQLMNDTLDINKSNKIILDVLKNSDFFKELGSFPKEMKVLIELLESQSGSNTKLDKLIQSLKLSLLELKQTDSGGLKDFIKNSGVFLESKFTQENNPKAEFKNALDQLKSLLLKSEVSASSSLVTKTDAILNNTKIFSKENGTASLNLIKKEVDTLLSSFKDTLKFADPLYSKDVQRLVAKLESFSQNPILKQEIFSLDSIKNIISELSSELRISARADTKALLSQLEGIQIKISLIHTKNTSLHALKELSANLQTLDISSLPKDEIKALNSLIAETKTLSEMSFKDIESLKFDDIKSFLSTLSEKILPLNTGSTKSIFDIIEKILLSLKQPLLGFEQEKIPKDIKNWLVNFDEEVSKADVLFSKSMQDQLAKISHFSKPAHLLDNSLLQENLQKDMKALLLTLEKELSVNPTQSTTETLKSVEKLLMQVEYFQLLSHLSNASYLYLPYAWDGFDNGKFSFKKKDDGSSYCEIDLELKEYGKLNMVLQLFDDNQLNMMIYTQKKELKRIFKDHIKELRSSLMSVNVMPRNIHILDLDLDAKRLHPYTNGEQLNELGFEVKG